MKTTATARPSTFVRSHNPFIHVAQLSFTSALLPTALSAMLTLELAWRSFHRHKLQTPPRYWASWGCCLYECHIPLPPSHFAFHPFVFVSVSNGVVVVFILAAYTRFPLTCCAILCHVQRSRMSVGEPPLRWAVAKRSASGGVRMKRRHFVKV